MEGFGQSARKNAICEVVTMQVGCDIEHSTVFMEFTHESRQCGELRVSKDS